MLIQDKLVLIDLAFGQHSIKSFAELGCAWGVDGGYGFYTLDNYEISRAVQVDRSFTDTMKARAPAYSQLRLLRQNFGDAELPETVGEVDAVILFDVLLHQVKPDWDGILRMWAPGTKHFLIYNQQWIRDAHTCRLLDLGKQEYFKSVPAGSENFKSYLNLFDRLDEPVPDDPGRLCRDNISIWQWGITDADLVTVLAELGFNLAYFRNCGKAFDIENFENHSFLFSKRP
jgi:hypothetical protein